MRLPTSMPPSLPLLVCIASLPARPPLCCPQIRGMKEEELAELLGELLQAEHLISSFVAGLPLEEAAEAAGAAGGGHPVGGSSGSGEGDGDNSSSSSESGSRGSRDEQRAEGLGLGLGLELVGRAVAVDPLAAAAAAAAFALGAGGEGPAEVVALSAEEAAQRGQLIAAYRPPRPASKQEAGGSSGGGELTGQAAVAAVAEQLDGVAAEELVASLESGALSLLLTSDSSGRGSGSSGGGKLHLEGGKLRSLLAQLPGAGGAGDEVAEGWQVTADAVARSLGLRHASTVAALELMFAGSSSGVAVDAAAPANALAETIWPGEAEATGPAGQDAAAAASSSGRAAGQTFSLEQVEQGLSRLLQLLAPQGSEEGKQPPPRQEQHASLPPAAQPTSKQYWQGLADAALPAAVARSWELLERQASKQFATLQGRTANADEVSAWLGSGTLWVQEMRWRAFDRSACQHTNTPLPCCRATVVLCRCCRCGRRMRG